MRITTVFNRLLALQGARAPAALGGEGDQVVEGVGGVAQAEEAELLPEEVSIFRPEARARAIGMYGHDHT